MKIGDRVINISNEIGTIICVSEGLKGRLWYSVKYDFDPNRTFLNSAQMIEIYSPRECGLLTRHDFKVSPFVPGDEP